MWGTWWGISVSFCCRRWTELQVEQLLMKFLKSFRKVFQSGQKTVSRVFRRLVSIPEWPVWIFVKNLECSFSGMSTLFSLKIRPLSIVSSSLYVQKGCSYCLMCCLFSVQPLLMLAWSVWSTGSCAVCILIVSSVWVVKFISQAWLTSSGWVRPMALMGRIT